MADGLRLEGDGDTFEERRSMVEEEVDRVSSPGCIRPQVRH
jgi:hypothetical protein